MKSVNRKYYHFLMLLLLMFSCGNKSNNAEEIHQGKVYMNEYGRYVFLIDDKFYTVWKCDECFFTTFPTDDSIVSSQGEIYYKYILPSCTLKNDIIEIANSMELPRHSIGFLYNLRVINTRWEVAIYHPCRNIKGTYSFNIAESERKIFEGILHEFQENAKQRYYPIQDTSKLYSTPIPTFYLNIQLEEESFEYFGSTVLFDMLSQITTVILENHILSDSSKNKVSDTIKLLDVREQFDYYVSKDCCTGFIVKDFDSIIPPPPSK